MGGRSVAVMRDRRGMVDESEGGILIEEIGKALRKKSEKG